MAVIGRSALRALSNRLKFLARSAASASPAAKPRTARTDMSYPIVYIRRSYAEGLRVIDGPEGELSVHEAIKLFESTPLISVDPPPGFRWVYSGNRCSPNSQAENYAAV
jgi:hypothetical protein